MRSFQILKALAAPICTLVLSCAPAGNTSETHFKSLDFVCAEDQVPLCKNALGWKAFLGFSKNTVTNCAVQLKTSGIATLYQSFNYSSQTDVFNDGTDAVWGRFQSYFDSEGDPAPALKPGFYKVCGFVDANSNGFLDSGEPLLAEIWNPATDLYRLFENWEPSP